ncbi:MAG: hypothetical protein ACRDOI_00090 [Trebonia sp.]
MRRNVMIYTATLTAIAALGGITAGSASAATGAPTTLTGSPNAATAVSASPAMYVATGAGSARVCAIMAAPGRAWSHAEKAAKVVIAVPDPAVSGVTKPARLVPAKAIALSKACPDGVCVTVVPAHALRHLKGVGHGPTVFAGRAVHSAGAEDGAGSTEVKLRASAIACSVPGVAGPAK